MTTRTLKAGIATRKATIGPASIDKEARTVQLAWAQGVAVQRYSWMLDEAFNECLSMDPESVRMGRLQSGNAPLLNTHSSYSLSDIIGVVESAEIVNGEGRATVRFSKRAEVDPIWQDVCDGIIRNVSVGYNIYAIKETTAKGDEMRTFTVTDWEPHELSLVPVPADATATVRATEQSHSCTITEIEVSSDSRDSDEVATPMIGHLLMRVDLASREL